MPELKAIEDAIGPLRKALRITYAHNNPADLEHARSVRADDLKLFLALHQFQRRRPYKTLESRIQRDIRAFFGNYMSAQEHAKKLLFEVASPATLDESCRIEVAVVVEDEVAYGCHGQYQPPTRAERQDGGTMTSSRAPAESSGPVAKAAGYSAFLALARMTGP